MTFYIRKKQDGSTCYLASAVLDYFGVASSFMPEAIEAFPFDSLAQALAFIRFLELQPQSSRLWVSEISEHQAEVRYGSRDTLRASNT